MAEGSITHSQHFKVCSDLQNEIDRLKTDVDYYRWYVENLENQVKTLETEKNRLERLTYG